MDRMDDSQQDIDGNWQDADGLIGLRGSKQC